jgi:ribonucleoside-diphosphate reductase alpha chain
MPGEIFIKMAKTGSTINGLIDAFALAISLGLQYGLPLEVLVNKFSHQRFEPSGFTQNPNIRIAKSITDYIARWLALKFLDSDAQALVGLNANQAIGGDQLSLTDTPTQTASTQPTVSETPTSQSTMKSTKPDDDAPACPECGAMTIRSGTCYKCTNCGSTTGCS